MQNIYETFNGINLPPKYNKIIVNYALNYKPTCSDVFLITYPKSGTTWTDRIIYLLLNPLENEKYWKSDERFERKGYVNKVGSKLNLINTHIPFGFIRYEQSAKNICVFRNPKDVCVSFYHMMKKYHEKEIRFNFNDFFNMWIEGEVPYGKYFEHVLPFWSHRMDNNFEYLVYEQMKKNPKDSILKIAKFLGDNYVTDLTENNEFRLNKVLEYSTFDYMKSLNIHNSYARMRKGIVGDWRNHLSENQSDLIDDKFDEYFTGTGLETLWIQDMKYY